MGILLNGVLVLAFAAPPLLALAVFVYYFSAYRKEGRDAPRSARALFPVVFFGLLTLVLMFVSVFYAVLIFSGEILM